MDSTVSVIIPTYNRADLLPRTIRSVLNQTFPGFELIIVDDGSTDNTQDVVEEFQKKDRRVQYIKLDQNSGGPAHPKNIGIQNSNGKFIAFLDHDDEWLPEKLEEQLELFNSRKKRLGFVGCNALIVQGERKREYKTPKYQNVFPKILKSCFIWSSSSVIIKKEVWNEISLFDENLKLSDDWDMWIRIAQKYDFDFVDKPLFKYYYHENNTIKIMGEFQAIRDFKYILKKHENFYQKYPKAHSTLLRNIGSMYIVNNDLKTARKYLIQAIGVAPWYLRSYLNFIISLFGVRFYKRIFYEKRKMAGVFLVYPTDK